MADQSTPAEVERGPHADSTAIRVAMCLQREVEVDPTADPTAYISRLETVLARRSQELLEADEREAALVRRFREQMMRIAELERHVREQNEQIQELQAVLPQRLRGHDSELLRIRGIGPRYARALEALGVERITAIAALSGADVHRIEQQLRIRNGRIQRERWVEQAQALLADNRDRP